mmetsp:Transcript_26821/g.57036  ORF Transcript_26821/g.57036 Transcript_26821/m.57036 type:complete len:654 (+) Transcript_26821:153-2114(+)
MMAAGFRCETCGITCSSDLSLRQHLKGTKHQKVILQLRRDGECGGADHAVSKNSKSSEKHKEKVVVIATIPFRCKVCGVSCTSDVNLQMHLKGKKHKEKVAALGGLPNMVDGGVCPSSLQSVETYNEEKKEEDAIVSPSETVKPNTNRNEKKDEVKIAVHDSVADIITFKESVGGKSAHQGAEKILDESLDFGSDFEDLSLSEKAATMDEVASSLFRPKIASNEVQKNRGLSLYGGSAAEAHAEGALFGHLFPSSPSEASGEAVYLNTHEPFCFATVGLQGAGKSHTSACVLESCLVPFAPGNIVKLKAPMMSMVLHYDQNVSSICEAAGLLSPDPSIKSKMNRLGHDVGAVPKDKAVILVSPAFYRQRKKFYGDYCTVKPLLFRWRSLTADHIKRIMRIESGDNQLYVASFLDLLRGYQRQAVVPEFSDFLNEVRKVCNANGQKGPLDQRISLLESVVAESEKNSALVEESLDLISCSKKGYRFIIADLTDPLLSKEEANGLFQVLTEQFRTLPTKGGKLLCLDEAHKYMTGEKADGLSEAIVNVARLMRHDGVRLVVSTQSPKALAPELLELVTVAVLHHFHSPDWWSYLKSKLPLHEGAFERILSLNRGEAVAFATCHNLSVENVEGSHCLPMRIRPRMTEDLGSSRRNS